MQNSQLEKKLTFTESSLQSAFEKNISREEVYRTISMGEFFKGEGEFYLFKWMGIEVKTSLGGTFVIGIDRDESYIPQWISAIEGRASISSFL